jgi:predicted Zn-dependent protease
MAFEEIVRNFRETLPVCDFWSLRLLDTTQETLSVRENVVQPPVRSNSRGAHITLMHKGGMGYAATSELTREGFQRALQQALAWCERTTRHGILSPEQIARPKHSGRYDSPVGEPWQQTPLQDKLSWLQEINRSLKLHDNIVDWQAHLSHRETRMLLLTSDGIEIEQGFHYIAPGYQAVANKGAQTQVRSGGGWGTARQGGLEQLAAYRFPDTARQVAEEALALVDAPECPDGKGSLLLMPSQMMLQIHESIGHPLELDRILGDERNYAGTSFVTLDMFGSYQYGSELLNVSSNAPLPEELASFGFDDDGSRAEKQAIIRNGILVRPLGGATSQARAEMPGVANARACDWNRPAIDRMANLNVEPGESRFDQLVASIEDGVLMETNKSWSIDDSRNKFQFGCELGRIIKDGEIRGLVRNPNYRGISASFWRNLSGVGDASTFEIWGTPNCGKGEPNQMIHVGHASPACVFDDVEIFGGA